LSPSINHQSRDGPLKADQFFLDCKKLLYLEDIQQETELQLQALKEPDPEIYKEIPENEERRDSSIW
jgi:hypothetical protein